MLTEKIEGVVCPECENENNTVIRNFTLENGKVVIPDTSFICVECGKEIFIHNNLSFGAYTK